MRRREKFVIAAILLSLGLLGVQYISLEYRYWAVSVFFIVSYLVSSWALSDDLQKHEWLTVVPVPALYSAAVSLFYFLLPIQAASRFIIFLLFGIGMYALYLTANIFSVAKGRTIQLLHAAHAISLIFSLLISLLVTNTIFSLRLPFYWTTLLVGISHVPIIFTSLWSVKLENTVSRELIRLTILLSLVITEFTLVLSFFPYTIWHSSLFVMSLLYICLGFFHSYIKERLFTNTIREFALVSILVGVLIIILFPGK